MRRFLGGRAIPLNIQAMNDIALELVEAAAKATMRISPNMQLEGIDALSGQQVTVESVKGGEPFTVGVTLRAVKKPGKSIGDVDGHYDPRRHRIYIDLNGDLVAEQLDRLKYDLLSDISSVLIHEMTHARDVLPRHMIDPKEKGDYVGYMNQPHEVKAYGQQLVQHVVAAWRRLEVKSRHKMNEPPTTDGKFIESLIEGTKDWRQIDKFMTEKNKRVVRLMATRAVLDLEEEMRG